MLHVDMQITLGDDDLRKVSRTCAIAGVSVRFPLLDDDLAEFSARVPPRLSIKGRHLRYFFKYAFRDVLPRSTLTKSKAGFGLPVAHWLHAYRPLEDMACDALSSLKERGLFRTEFLDGLLDAHRRADPNRYRAYFSEPIWVLTILDHWLRSHDISRTVYTGGR
jgi:asparagine synthase (glutamine-hydrolysing)